MEVDRNGLEVLDREECLRLLGTARLGRVALSESALPVILPVNFWLDEERIIVNTGEGSKLATALKGAVIAFEVDEFNGLDHTGWSVVATGLASVITDVADLERLRRSPIPRWAPDGGGHYLAISLDMLRGRRITHARPYVGAESL